MSINIPESLPEKKQPSATRLTEDEFIKILQIVEDEDLGKEGSPNIEESAHIERLKEESAKQSEISGDKEESIQNEAAKRAAGGNVDKEFRIYTLSKGEDLRQASVEVYGVADKWVLIAVVNKISDPSSSSEIYAGRQLTII